MTKIQAAITTVVGMAMAIGGSFLAESGGQFTQQSDGQNFVQLFLSAGGGLIFIIGFCCFIAALFKKKEE